MNILYCGDSNILDGLIISILSIIKNTKEQLNIYLFTMDFESQKKKYYGIKEKDLKQIREKITKVNPNSTIKIMDIGDIVLNNLPTKNVNSFFTPYCMLRLYADMIDDLPDKILYLDTDVVCLKDPMEFYNLDLTNYELAGVLDYYGSHVIKKKINTKDYLNSGVLLLNMPKIKETDLFTKARKRCATHKMIMPDQTAINILCKSKLIVPRKYNEQKKIHDDTIFRHFSSTFKFWPTIAVQTIKPWHIDKLHDVLKVHEFDDVLEEYLEMKKGDK